MPNRRMSICICGLIALAIPAAIGIVARDYLLASYFLAGELLAAGLCAAVIWRFTVMPLRKMIAWVREIQQGNFAEPTQIPEIGKDKYVVAQLDEALGAMTTSLRESRRLDHQGLLRTQETTRSAINSLPHGVAVLNPDGVIELANRPAETLFGLLAGARVETLGLSWLVPMLHEVQRTLQRVEPKGYESAIQVFHDGQEKFFLPHAIPILDEQRHLVGTLIVLVDATQLRQIDEAKSGLISTVSHELKTPLTSIQMSILLLLEDTSLHLTPRQLELLQTARDDADRLNRLIEDLLDLGRLKAGRADMQFAAVLPRHLVDTALEPLLRDFRAKDITVDVQVPNDLPPVRIDLRRASYVLGNLLANACKYSHQGGHVKVSAVAAETLVQFAVADDGVGVPLEYRDRVFERYVRIPSSAEGAAGVGLGLTIAREIVEAHGGTIGVVPNHPNGAIFHFTLPRGDLSPAPGAAPA